MGEPQGRDSTELNHAGFGLIGSAKTVRERYRLAAREVEIRLGPEVAAAYMQTRNFALGGHSPAELVATEEGTRQVLAEISACADGGPL